MHGSSHVCMKDCELCASTWLQPTNAEFVSMRFFFYLFLIKARLHMCVPTFSHLQKYSLCQLLCSFPQGTRLARGTRLLAFPSYPGTNLALWLHKLTLLWKPALVAHRNHIAVTGWTGAGNNKTVHVLRERFWHTNKGRQFEVEQANYRGWLQLWFACE